MGVRSFTGKINNIHTSGHLGQHEQNSCLGLDQTKILCLVHGEYWCRRSSQDCMHCGAVVQAFIMSNGDVPAYSQPARIAGSFNAQDIYVDGNRIGEISRCPSWPERPFKTVLCFCYVTVDSNRRWSWLDQTSCRGLSTCVNRDLIQKLTHPLHALHRLEEQRCQSPNRQWCMSTPFRPFLYESNVNPSLSQWFSHQMSKIKNNPVETTVSTAVTFEDQKRVGQKSSNSLEFDSSVPLSVQLSSCKSWWNQRSRAHSTTASCLRQPKIFERLGLCPSLFTLCSF